MANNPTSSKIRQANIVPFGRKGRPAYVHDIPAFLKQTACARDDTTVTISDPNSDAGLCARCGEPAMFEYTYISPFDDEPQLRAKVVQAFCAAHWREYIIEKFIPEIHAHLQDKEEDHE